MHADSGFCRLARGPEIIKTHPDVNSHVAMTPGKRNALDKVSLTGELAHGLEKLKASIRAKVEHSFWAAKGLWNHAKVRYRGLAENTRRSSLPCLRCPTRG